MKEIVTKAMEHWQLYTCIQFEAYNSSDKSHNHMSKLLIQSGSGTM